MFSIFLLLFLLNIPSALSWCSHGTYLDSCDGGDIHLPDYDYGTTLGPVNWHNIQRDYKLCGTGHAQSPIDITKSILPEPSNIVHIILPVQTRKFENLKTTVEVVLMNGLTAFDTKWYLPRQFHFHTPSEHRINGEHFPVEMHMVHSEQSKIRKSLRVKNLNFNFFSLFLYSVSHTFLGGSCSLR